MDSVSSRFMLGLIFCSALNFTIEFALKIGKNGLEFHFSEDPD